MKPGLPYYSTRSGRTSHLTYFCSIEDLKYSAYFVPVYTGNHLRARVQKRLEISVDGEV